MPRIPEDVITQIKRDVSLQRLAEAAGIHLKPAGKAARGLCPFHSEKTPSFTIDLETNTFRCYGCDAHGTSIDWVMRMNGLSFTHAVELLKADLPGLLENAPARPLKVGTVRRLPAAVSLGASDLESLDQVAAFYHKRLFENPHALTYLEARGLADPETLAHFRIGFADRTLGLTLPERNRDAGAELRKTLTRLGILRETSGHEHFRGCITVPLTDEDGHTRAVYGRRLAPAASRKVPASEREPIKHLYMPGPHRAVFNIAAIAACDELLLCESPFDALTFWAAGFKNVTSAYGVNGFTRLHMDAFAHHKTRRVLIAYDNDPAGNAAAVKLAREFIRTGLEVFRIQLPHGMDVNEYATKVKPASKSLELLIRSARWLGKGPAPEHRPPMGRDDDDTTDARSTSEPTNTSSFAAGASEPAPRPEPPPTNSELPGQLHLFAEDEPAPALAPAAESMEPTPAAAPAQSTAKEEAFTLPSPAAGPSEDTTASTEPPTPDADAALPETLPARTPPVASSGVLADSRSPGSREQEPARPLASPVPTPPEPPPLVAVTENEASLVRGDRRYRVRGLAANSRFDALRVNLLVQSPVGFHVDTFDLFHAKARAAFEKCASLELGCSEATLHDDLRALLMALDHLQDSALAKGKEAKDPSPTLSAQERAEALELLRDRQLVRRILDDFDAAGVVGEETNKLVGYLAAISRKLRRPLALVVQSSSSAGKSTLMDAVLDFVPAEECEQFSAMTGQALFYMGQTNLAHKVLAIVEEEGAERASYALKLLQSEGKLKIASTGKDPTTGRLVTHEYEVMGPVMIFLTTTAHDLDDELQNRCLILTVDEDREQTRAIHARQRHRRTLDGLFAADDKSDIQKRHQNAQRLLKPLTVLNPFVHRLTFMDDRTRTRRDHEKYLTLIDTLALLHQHQRPMKSATRKGKTLHYIEATLDDIAIANRLADEVLGRSLDELPPQTRKLLSLLDAMVTAGAAAAECRRADYRFTRRQVREQTGWGNTQLKLHLARLEDFEYLVSHRSGPGLSFAYELTYDGRGADGRPFLTGLIDVDKLAAELGQAPKEGKTGEDCHDYDANRSGVNAHRSGPEASRSGGGRPLVGPRSAPGRPVQNAESLHENSDSLDPTPKLPKITVTPLSRKVVPYRKTAARRSESSPAAGMPDDTDELDTPPVAASFQEGR